MDVSKAIAGGAGACGAGAGVGGPVGVGVGVGASGVSAVGAAAVGLQASFPELFWAALDRRRELVAALLAENTTAWRCFNGATEGRPGLTVDRYGEFLLVLVFFQPLSALEREMLVQYASDEGLRCLIWDRREESGYRYGEYRLRETEDEALSEVEEVEAVGEDAFCWEQGQRFFVSAVPRARAKAMDPYFYLDFRAARRWLRANVGPGSAVLNLFSYTCTAGAAAAAAGASVVNVDFGRWCMEVGRKNASLSGLPETRCRFVSEDVFPVIWQLAGLPVKGRASARRYVRLEAQVFDVVVLDPPTMASSRFGKVDIVHDYPALLKPCLLCTKPGGVVLAANHSAEVSREAWKKTIVRTGEKCGRPVLEVSFLAPEADFPSSDGEHPLKLALIRV